MILAEKVGVGFWRNENGIIRCTDVEYRDICKINGDFIVGDIIVIGEDKYKVIRIEKIMTKIIIDSRGVWDTKIIVEAYND